MFEWLWGKKVIEEKVIQNPQIFIFTTKNPVNGDDIINIEFNWPKNLSKDGIRDIFSKLLFLTQSGCIYDLFNEALTKRCNEAGFPELPTEIAHEIQNLLANSTVGQPREDKHRVNSVVYPSQVFHEYRGN